MLIVTPNAVMFDPDVTDPVVKENGAEMYGVITPLDTIIALALYHDISAMDKSLPRFFTSYDDFFVISVFQC